MHIHLMSEIRQLVIESLTSKFSADTLDIGNETQRLELNEHFTSDLDHKVEELALKYVKINNFKLGVRHITNQNYLEVYFEDSVGHSCMGTILMSQDGMHAILDYICLIVYKVVHGQSRIDYLNSVLDARRIEKGSLLAIKYAWGISKDCCIAYWDTSLLVIRLNELAIDSLIESDISEEIKDVTWSDNLVDTLCEYNGSLLSKITYSTIKEPDKEGLIDLLSSNMLLIEDVVDIVSNARYDNGIQKIKSVSIVNSGLGAFVALLVWELDYQKRLVDVRVFGDRIIDIDNKTFISDKSMYNRVEAKILEEGNLVSSKFQGLAS